MVFMPARQGELLRCRKRGGGGHYSVPTPGSQVGIYSDSSLEVFRLNPTYTPVIEIVAKIIVILVAQSLNK